MLLKTLLKGPALAGVLVVLAHAATGQATGQGTGLITGQVVDADSGKGIPNAPVALIGVPGPGAPGH